MAKTALKVAAKKPPSAVFRGFILLSENIDQRRFGQGLFDGFDRCSRAITSPAHAAKLNCALNSPPALIRMALGHCK